MKNLKTSRRERGQSLVELAASVTVLLILLAGAVDLGRAFFNYIAMRDAAQEGLVYASIDPTRCDLVEARILDTIDNVVANTKLEYETGAWQTCDAANDAAVTWTAVCLETPIRVTVERTDFPITMPFLGGFIGSQQITIRATVIGSVLKDASASCP